MFVTQFEKVADLRTYPSSFDSHEVEEEEYPRTRGSDFKSSSMEDIEFAAARRYSGIKHNPLTRSIFTGGKWGIGLGVPIGIIAAIAAKSGERAKKALLLGGGVGASAALIAGGLKARTQIYTNKVDDAHMNYHLDRMGYVPGK